VVELTQVNRKGTLMKPIDLFYTPKSMEEMQDMLERLDQSDRAKVYPYVMMMYNLLTSQFVKE